MNKGMILSGLISAVVIVSVTVAAISVFSADTAADPWDGKTSEWHDAEYAFGTHHGTDKGSEGNPFMICNGGQLKLLAELVNGNVNGYNNSGVHYKLTENIILNDTSQLSQWGKGLAPKNVWVPIGTHAVPFKANFDGNGKAICGIYIDNDDRTENGKGLFGCINGKIKDLSVQKSHIRSGSSVGGIAGCMDGGSVTNCSNSGAIFGSDRTGGIAGHLKNGMIAYCSNTGAICGRSNTGGMAGCMDDGSVIKCSNSGAICGSCSTGGILGSAKNCMVLNCSNNGPVHRMYIAGGYGEAHDLCDLCAVHGLSDERC